MKKLIVLLLLPHYTFSQNVGISDISSFTPTQRLDVDGNIKVRENIFLDELIIDTDNQTFMIDISSESRFNEINFTDGSNTDPSIWFDDDDNTGIYQPSNGSIGFTINGTEAIRITSSRNLFLNNNDITGLNELHFDSGSIWIDGDPGDNNQVIKSDGNNIYWDDQVFEKAVTIDFNTTWSHPIHDIEIDFTYTNSSSTSSFIIYNNTTETWRFFFSGIRNSSNETIDTYSITSNNNQTISIPSSGATIGVYLIGTSYSSEKGFIYQIVGYGPSKLFRGTLTYW